MRIFNISKSYKKKKILNKAQIEINKGDFILLMGSNGSGKSTLIKLLSGLIRTDDNKEIKLSSVGYLPEKFTLPKTLAVKDFIDYLEKDNNINLDTYIRSLEIPYKNIKELSKGNLQKLGLLYLVSCKKDYLILDEPTEGMDINLKRKFISILKELNKKGKTIIISTHSKGEYARINKKEYNVINGVLYEEFN